MLTQICAELRNYFIRGLEDIHHGHFSISDGKLSLSFLQPGQYYRIIHSVFNDGVHKYGDGGLVDESFVGEVWAMAVPPAVVALSDDVKKWVEDNADAINSPFSSESYGNYSYSMNGSSYGSNNNQGGASWQNQFAQRLAPYRRLFPI